MRALFAIVIALVGLLMSSCGILYLILAMNSGNGIVWIALPSVVVGGIVVWSASVMWRTLKASRSPPKAPEAPPPPAKSRE